MPNKPVSIYVAPKYLHYDLRLQYMKEHQTTSFQHVTFLTLDHLLDQVYPFPKRNNSQQQIELYHLLTNIETTVFSDVLLTPSFLQELLRIMNTLLDNQVDITDFPEDTASRKELKHILQQMRDHMQFLSDDRAKAMERLLQMDDLSHICFVQFVASSQQEVKLYEALKQLGIQTKDHHITKITTQYHYALNIRQEVEATAQQISQLLQQGNSLDDIALVVSDLTTYTPFIELVFPRYHLPYTMLDQPKDTQLKRFFHALLSYYEKPSTNTFLNFISHPLLAIPHIKEFKEYVQHTSLSLEELWKPFVVASQLNEHINPYTKKNLLLLEEAATMAQSAYLELLNSIHAMQFSHLIMEFYRFLVRKQDQLSPADVSYLQSLRFAFTPLLEDYDTIPLSLACVFAQDVLSTIRVEIPRTRPSIVITDGKRPPMPVSIGYALGFYQPTYPNFKPLSGILDEAIASLLPSFEPLASRYHRHIQTYETNLHFAHHVVFSYPQGNFEGKVYESSLDLEMQFNLGKPQPWFLMENESYHRIQHQLDPDLAQQLFLQNNELVGSISRFEAYFRCPYSYFLKYGLKLQDPLRFDLKEAEIGQIYHGFLEDVVAREKKNYILASEEQIASYLNGVLASYKSVFAQDSRLFELVEEQLRHQVQSALLQLKEMEDHTSFEPTMVEKDFDHIIAYYGDIAIRLRGIIDRIDEIAHGFRILDYKSSARSLKLDDFYAGLALQLVTYTHIIAQLSEKQPFGCYYVNLSQPSSTHIPYHIDRRKKVVTYRDEQTYCSENQAPVKLQGLTFVDDPRDIALLDDSQSMIAGLSYRKTGKNPGPSVRNPIDFTALSTDLQALYQELARQLLDGEIALTPIEGACTYCNFKVICHFHSKGLKPKPIIQSSIQQKEEVEE